MTYEFKFWPELAWAVTIAVLTVLGTSLAFNETPADWPPAGSVASPLWVVVGVVDFLGLTLSARACRFDLTTIGVSCEVVAHLPGEHVLPDPPERRHLVRQHLPHRPELVAQRPSPSGLHGPLTGAEAVLGAGRLERFAAGVHVDGEGIGDRVALELRVGGGCLEVGDLV